MFRNKKIVIGYIFTAQNITYEEKLFLKLAKEKNLEIVMMNLSQKVDEREFEDKIKKCDFVYNTASDDFVIEFLKTAEELGKKVLDASKLYYYTEDKWMFYLKCREHKVPTPETILLAHNLNAAKSELKRFNRWPVILKRIYGSVGRYVEKADTLAQAVGTLKKFYKKDLDKQSIIAQEFIKSPSYRVTIIDNKIVQTAVKKNTGWKCTGEFGDKFERFKIDKELEKILKKVMKFTKIIVCGIDLLKKNGKWVVLEANSSPSLDFFDNEWEYLIDLVLIALKKYYRRHLAAKNKST
jgi:RimK family alpha-L-glutamate ligase